MKASSGIFGCGEIEDPCTGSAFNADPAQHQVSNHTGGVLGDQRQLRNELFRRPNALDERRKKARDDAPG
jgi:hypothetical protein